MENALKENTVSENMVWVNSVRENTTKEKKMRRNVMRNMVISLERLILNTLNIKRFTCRDQKLTVTSEYGVNDLHLNIITVEFTNVFSMRHQY